MFFSNIILLAFLYFGNCEKTPEITFISSTQTKNAKDRVELVCTAKNAQDSSLLWYKSYSDKTESILLTTGSKRIVDDSRISVDYDDKSSKYELKIKKLKVEDKGVYTCVIRSPNGSDVTADVELVVQSPPYIFDNSTRSMHGNEGQNVQLECYAGGFPEPQISWRRENNVILPTGDSIYHGNILNIEALKQEYIGTYYCVAENGVGKSVKRKVELEVQIVPTVTVPREIVGQALTYDADLVCHVQGFPSPTITWHKNGQRLSFHDPHYRISYFSTDNAVDATLRIVTVGKNDYGVFTCKARNKLGEAHGTVELIETTNPVCPPACG